VSVILAAMMLVASPEVPQGQTGDPVEVTGKKKHKQRCQYTEVSGSRMRQRVCTDENGNPDKIPGVTDAASNPGLMHATPGPAEGGLGGAPK
jgi:hypothetical protein